LGKNENDSLSFLHLIHQDDGPLFSRNSGDRRWISKKSGRLELGDLAVLRRERCVKQGELRPGHLITAVTGELQPEGMIPVNVKLNGEHELDVGGTPSNPNADGAVPLQRNLGDQPLAAHGIMPLLHFKPSEL
jgi:hypothetical protein